MSKGVRCLLTAGLIVVLWILPVPEGLMPEAWHLFAIFAGTILGFVLQPFPLGTVALAAITFAALTNTIKPAEALAGFSNTSDGGASAGYSGHRTLVGAVGDGRHCACSALDGCSALCAL